jgi:hypothetical protein
VERKRGGQQAGRTLQVRQRVALRRYPYRQSAKTLTGWRFSLPIILTGVEPPLAKLAQATHLILAGREEEVAQMWEAELRSGQTYPWFNA